MNEVKYKAAHEPPLAIAAAEADKLLDRGDASAALLYIYMLRCGGAFTMAEAASRLRLPAARLRSAAEALADMGLISISGVPAPAEELPEYSTEEMSERTMESAEFASLTAEVQSLFGRVLSGTELKLLFGIYDYLALPPEVILMLISHCIEETEKRLGPGRRPSMRSVEREAYVWVNREICTLEAAEAHLRRLQRLDSELEKTKAAIGIQGRSLSSTERKYIEGWLELGFTHEALAIAYDRTVLKTGKLQWKYMDSIVRSWHGKGLHTPAEIAEGDTMAPPRLQSGPAEPDRGGIERMERLMSRMKKD
jgi:DnaD/phage-associated family protein